MRFLAATAATRKPLLAAAAVSREGKGRNGWRDEAQRRELDYPGVLFRPAAKTATPSLPFPIAEASLLRFKL